MPPKRAETAASDGIPGCKRPLSAAKTPLTSGSDGPAGVCYRWSGAFQLPPETVEPGTQPNAQRRGVLDRGHREVFDGGRRVTLSSSLPQPCVGCDVLGSEPSRH